MSAPLRLFDLFGEPDAATVAAVWSQRVQSTTGFSGDWPPPDLVDWLAALNNAVVVSNVRTGADDDRVSVEATLTMPGSVAYPEGFPFVLASMPDVEFRIRPATAIENQIQLFASMSDSGVEFVLERLPVEIRLPIGLIEPHPKPGGGIPDGTPTYEIGDFRPGHLDDLKVRYDRAQPASIFVHIRLHMTEQGEFAIRPAVPASFGKCVLSGIPALAIHDFLLLPSATVAPREVHWLRHEVTPWAPALSSPLDGMFAIRSLHVDPDTTPIVDLANYLNSHKDPADKGTSTTTSDPPPPPGTSDTHAEFVLDDLVVPFYSPWVLPIPRHVTIGVRRRILDKNDPKQVFTFDNAPVRAFFSRSPETGILVDSFFFKSLPSGVGLTFDAAFVFGDTHDVNDKSEAMALGIGLEEDYTFTVSYKRDFSTATGMPEPGTGAAKTLNDLLHFEIAANTIDIMTIRLGYSLGRHFGAHASFGDSVLATVDLFVSMPPTGGEKSLIKLRSLNGEIVKFIIEGLGWRLGSMHLEGATLPDGVVLLIADKYGLVLQELGLRAEDTATYLSFSGGLQVDKPSGFKGSFLVKRLRFRVAGDHGAPPVKLDGFFLRLETTGFLMEAGGFYSETRSPGVFVREFGLTGSVGFGSGKKRYTFGLDFLIGHTETTAETFDYLFAQVFFTGSVPMGAVELRGVRALFARNMKPKLDPVDKESRELRYYTWYKHSDPLTVPGDRRIAAWVARSDSLAFGLGASISFPGFGTVAELGAFALYVRGPDEDELLIVVEIRLLHNPHPIGYLAIEYAFKEDLWHGVLGVELRVSDFVKDAPDWMNHIGGLTGTLFVGNDPGTFAIGRLADQKTWLLLHLDYDLWVRTFFEFGLCLEFVSHGPHGVGFFMRVEGGINAGIVRVVYHAGFGFSFSVLSTGSHDYAAQIFIEAALRIVLFGFLHYGIGAKVDFRTVGTHPSRGELHLEVRLETPWFMPDVTWSLDIPFGTLSIGDLATSTSPLRAAGGTEGLQLKSAPLHVERFDQAYANDRASRTFSVNELKAGGPSEATRLANFEADTTVRPVAIDTTLAVEFAVAVNDKLALSTGVAPNLGDQSSGDLTLTGDLVGISVRRRARFGSDRSWKPLDQRVELPPDFSDPAGVKLTGSLAEETIAAHWDLDETIAGQPATKRLLINSATPFQFVTGNPAGDEELVRGSPLFPCCDRKKLVLRTHRLSFDHEMLGAELDARIFSDSHSTFVLTRPAIARPQRAGTSLPPSAIVADLANPRPGVVAHMDFDQDVAYCYVSLGFSAAPGRVSLVAFDAAGRIVGTKTVQTTSASDFQSVSVGAQGPIRRIELRVIRPQTGFETGTGFLEIDNVAYVGLTDFLDYSRGQQTCGDTGGGYEGKGKLFFLPNHEYEIELTTRVTVAHPSATPVSADVPEYLYFKTKGLPGLNAVARVGEEVEQYVRGAYGGGRGFLYRREPAVLSFNEDFFVAVPLTLRPAGTSAEHTTLMRMQLLARADTAINAGTPFTSTTTDWIVDHRGHPGRVRTTVWDVRASLGVTLGTAMVSTEPTRARLATLTQRPGVNCGLGDPRNVVGSVLIAPPQGETDPDDATKELWPASQNHTATVRMEGAAFVERVVFDPADLTAMQFLPDSGFGDSGDWTVVDGVLNVAIGTARRLAIFGETSWNHFSVTVSVSVLGPAAGVAIALPGGAPSQGLFALIEATSGGRRLVLYRRTSGAEMIELTHAPLAAAGDPAAPLSLQVNAFDDRIRATVGEQSIEADRDEQREGRVALVATGAAAFSNLGVAGVPIYAFPFRTSRYRSFNEHVLSWPGSIDSLAPDSLGPGTTTSTVAALWAATQTDVTAAMQPDADPSMRDDVIARWLMELGLALKDEVGSLEVSRFVVDDKTVCLLVESPEPLDFTTEVTVTLEHRVSTGGGVIDPPFGGLIDVFLAAARAPTAPAPPPQASVVDDVLRQLSGSDAASAKTVKPVPSVRVVDVARHARGLDVELAIDALPPGALADDRVVFVKQTDGADQPRLRVFTGRLRLPKRGATTARVRAVESDDVSVLRTADSVFRGAFGGAGHSRLVAIVPAIIGLGGSGVIACPVIDYVPIAVRVIQDGSARRALIVPMSNAVVPQSLAPGHYRLTLAMDRARWSTTAPPDDLSHYRDTATLTLEL